MSFPRSPGLAAVLAVWASGSLAAPCAETTVDMRWDGGAARFSVEIADDEAERSKGLMFRESMAAGSGMLFVYPGPDSVAFWMKNTLIPLDMLFIDAAGKVVKVHPNAVPGDLNPIPGEGPVRMVLEINGGLAARIGIPVGAELRHPRLDQDGALWPCVAP